MKFLKYLLVGSLTILTLAACEKEEEEKGSDSPENNGNYGIPELTVTATEWNAPAVGALTKEIGVEATSDWTAESADQWLSVAKSGTGIVLTASENDETKERSTKVTLTCTEDNKSASATITVTQDGLAYITASVTELSFGGDGNEATITVESNFDWECSTEETSWITLTKASNGTTLTVTVSENESDAREGTVILTAGDGAANVAEAQIAVKQEGGSVISEESMVLTYTIKSANVLTYIPLYGTVDCTIDWGDGTGVQTATSVWPHHTYASAGEYDVTVTGTVTALCSDGISTSSQPLPITAVKQWGKTGLVDLQYAFCHCENLKSLPEYTGDAFANVVYFYATFWYCTALEEIPAGMFGNCPMAIDFGWVFSRCSALKSVPENLFANCTGAISFKYAFQLCSSLKEVPSGIFNNCPNVTEFYGAFFQCTALETIPAGMFDNCAKATDFTYLFYDCSALKAIPSEGIFGGCVKADTFEDAFYGCSSLGDLPSGLFADCVAITNFHAAFLGCSSFTKLPDALFDSCTEVTTFYAIFQSCTSVTYVPTGLFDKNLKVTDFRQVFYNMSSVNGESPYTLLSDGTTKVHLYERANYITELGCVEPESYRYAFSGSSFSDMSSIPSDWGGKGN